MTALAVSTVGWVAVGFAVWVFLFALVWGLMIDTANRELAAREAYERMQAERTNAVARAGKRPS